MNAHRIFRNILIGSLVFATFFGVALVLLARTDGDAAAQEVKNCGILAAFVQSDGAERYRVRSISMGKKAPIAPCNPYYVIVFRKTADCTPCPEGGGAYDCQWETTWVQDGYPVDERSFESGTVAFVVISIFEHQAYRDEQGEMLLGEREKAEIDIYDIASKTFLAHTTLYGAGFQETYTTKIGSGNFTNAVSPQEINQYIESLF